VDSLALTLAQNRTVLLEANLLVTSGFFAARFLLDGAPITNPTIEDARAAGGLTYFNGGGPIVMTWTITPAAGAHTFAVQGFCPGTSPATGNISTRTFQVIDLGTAP
jgi:hypothetical protein